MNSQIVSWTGIVWALLLTLKVNAQVADPVLTVSGTSTSQQTISVTVTEATSGVTVNYTTNGTIPSQSSSSLVSPTTLLLPLNSMLKVQAFQTATVTSNLVSTQFARNALVSAGTAHSLFLKNNGTVYASGDNSAGELGNGTNTNSTQPVEVMTNSTTPLTGIVAIAADNNESMAVDNQGHVWAWGLNTNGELGLGNSTPTYYATQVIGLTNMLAIASEQNHTVALKADGSVWSWGDNGSGQVGNGTVSPWVTEPTQVIAPNTQSGPYLQSIVAVAAGWYHSLAIDNTGKVYAWGGDAYGQLGDGDATLSTQLQPVLVKKNGTPLTGVVGVTADGTNSFALTSAGTMMAWGDNSIGELANGTTSPIGTPVNLSPGQVANLGAMTVVGNQSAMDSNGTVWTWGDNSIGRLGIGYTGAYATLPLAVTLATPATPTLTATAGNGQIVTDGTYSSPFTISASTGQGTWVNFIVNASGNLLGLTSGATQLSPIIGGYVGSNGTVSFYLQAPANGSGSVSLTATSGGSQSLLSATEEPPGLAGPVGYWGLNEGTGTTTADSSGNANNGTLKNSPAWVSGWLSNALNFNGTNSYVDLNNTSTTNALKPALPVTISAWIKLTSNSGYQSIFSSDNFNSVYAGCMLETNGGVLECVYGTGSTSFRSKVGTTVLTAGQWYHVAAVIQGPSTMNLYVNGVDNGGTYGGTGTGLGYTTTSSKIGCRNGSTFFNGVIDDLRFYNRVLNPTEIGLLANGPVSNWRLDEGSGTNALDSGTAGITGTLVNSPTFTSGWLGDALSFNGTSSYINLNNTSATGPLKPALPVTISAWINLSSASGNRMIFSSDNFNTSVYAGYSISVSGGVLNCAYGSATGGNGPQYRRTKAGTTVLAVGEWYHVAAVIQGPTAMNLYVNGVDDGGTYSGTGGAIGYTTASSKIGQSGSINFFSGIIDDVRVYNRILSPTEIGTLDSASSGLIAPE